ncbi:MAG: c-type cytochrome [Pseudomonadota bacterium]|nr:c-type cytochrome [Pseudomonadota bacterium]
MKKLIAAAFALTSVAAVQAAVNMPAGDVAAGQSASAVCAACHGADGNSASAEFPRLAGQNAKYIYKQLMDYKSGHRDNAIMKAQVAALSPKQMADLAAYFSSRRSGVSLADPVTVAAGEKLYRGGDATRGIVPCSGCHSPDGRGNALAAFPRLGGQHASYVKAQLQAFRSAGRHDATGTKRGNDAAKAGDTGMMQMVASRLSDEDIEVLSNFISGLH